MSRYYSFNDFMNDVIEEADHISKNKKGYGLEELYNVKIDTIVTMKKLILNDWRIFIGVIIFLGTGSAALGISIAVFLTTPIGLIVAAILGGSAVLMLRQLYIDRALPQNVKEIGEKYKSKWKQNEGNRIKIDNMVYEAAEELYQKALNNVSVN